MNLDNLTIKELKTKLGRLNSAYFITDDRQIRQEMLLIMDELKVEIYSRGNNDKTS